MRDETLSPFLERERPGEGESRPGVLFYNYRNRNSGIIHPQA
jgi:hypothetical protein